MSKRTEWQVWARNQYCLTLIGACNTEEGAIALGSSEGARRYGDVSVDRHFTDVATVATFAALEAVSS